MRGIIRSLLASVWFMFLTFPILVIKVSPLDGTIFWRWENACYMGIGIFFLSFIWRFLLVRKGVSTAKEADLEWLFEALENEPVRQKIIAGVSFFFALIPLAISLVSRGGSGFSASLRKNEIGPLVAIAFFLVVSLFAIAALKKKDNLFTVLRDKASKLTESGTTRLALSTLLFLFLLPLPFFVDMYQVNILSSAFIWIMLGLGLNIVVGQTGLLVLGYVAFYAVGAYTYALTNAHFSNDVIGFWICLPLGGLFALFAGAALSLPVLRLRGDYLAIVTLGFGEITRVILEAGSLSLEPILSFLPENLASHLPKWMYASLDLGGPAGISGIPYPGFFGIPMSMDNSIRYVYYIALCMTLLTIFSVSRLRDSRIGRSWMAFREDEIACEAMGINKVVTKLSAFGLGACFAGFGGVLFASKTSFINPPSFTFMESALILSVVVLGGLGSILGVILGACVLILLPEYLRAMDEYRMLIFGASMVLMMVFRPQGLITPSVKRRLVKGSKEAREADAI